MASLASLASSSPPVTAGATGTPTLLRSINVRRGQTGSFGVSLVATNRGVSVSALISGGAAASDGKLCLDDLIHRVNGVNVEGWTLDQVADEVGRTGAGEDLIVDVWRDVPRTSAAPAPDERSPSSVDVDVLPSRTKKAWSPKKKRNRNVLVERKDASASQTMEKNQSPLDQKGSSENTRRKPSQTKKGVPGRNKRKWNAQEEEATVSETVSTRNNPLARQGASPKKVLPTRTTNGQSRALLPTRVSARMSAKKKRAALDAATSSVTAGGSTRETKESHLLEETSGYLSSANIARIQSTIRRIDSIEPTPDLALFRAFLHVIQMPSFHGRWYPLHGWAKIISSVYSSLLNIDADKMDISGEELSDTLIPKRFIKKFLGVTSGDLVWNESGLYLSLAEKSERSHNWCLFLGDCEKARHLTLKDVMVQWDTKWKDVTNKNLAREAVAELELEETDGLVLCAALKEMRRGNDEEQNSKWKEHVQRWRVEHPAAARQPEKEKPVDLVTRYPTLSKYLIPLTDDKTSKKERGMLLKELMKLDKVGSQGNEVGEGASLAERSGSASAASSSSAGVGTDNSSHGSSACVSKDRTEAEQYPIFTRLTSHMNIHSSTSKEGMARLLLGELLKKCATRDQPPIAEYRNGMNAMALPIPKIFTPKTRAKQLKGAISMNIGTNRANGDRENATAGEGKSSDDEHPPFIDIYGRLRRTRFVDHMLNHFANGNSRLGAEWIVRYWFKSQDKQHLDARQGVMNACRKSGYYIQNLDEHGLPVDGDDDSELTPHPWCTGTYYVDQIENLPMYVAAQAKNGSRVFNVSLPSWMCGALKDGKPRRDKSAQTTKYFPRSDAGFKKAMEWRSARIADYEKETGQDARAMMTKIAAKMNQQPRGEYGNFVLKRQRKGRRRRKVNEQGEVIDEEEDEEGGIEKEENTEEPLSCAGRCVGAVDFLRLRL